jgi:small subunit ribosomal protein S8
MVTDPIADFLTRIRNANQVYKDSLEIPASKMKQSMAEILKAEGYIKHYEYIKDGKQGVIRLYMKYGPNRQKVLTGLKRISKPGLRVYVRKDEIPRVLGGLQGNTHYNK